MEKQSIYKRFKQWIAGIGWKLFIWGNEYSQEEYWESIYQQELNLRTNSTEINQDDY